MRQDHNYDEGRPARILVYSLPDAVAALAAAAETGRPVELIYSAEALIALGPPAIRQIFDASRSAVPAARANCIVDCRNFLGLAMALIRAGVPALRVHATEPALKRLVNIAGQMGCRVEDDTEDVPILDLADSQDPPSACREWLATHEKGASGALEGALPIQNGSCI